MNKHLCSECWNVGVMVLEPETRSVSGGPILYSRLYKIDEV
jgi:hypothetical protein